MCLKSKSSAYYFQNQGLSKPERETFKLAKIKSKTSEEKPWKCTQNMIVRFVVRTERLGQHSVYVSKCLFAELKGMFSCHPPCISLFIPFVNNLQYP